MLYKNRLPRERENVEEVKGKLDGSEYEGSVRIKRKREKVFFYL
jgi:hypothetical protein